MPSSELSSSRSSSDSYRALSYIWGDPDEVVDCRIEFSDSSGDSKKEGEYPFYLKTGVFYIRSNLYEALRALRNEEVGVNVWGDAICINQQNFEEKAAQVAHMDDVYSAAVILCILLGEGDISTKPGLWVLTVRKILNLTELDKWS